MTQSTQPTEKKTQRILVVPLRFIGDTILTVPLLRNLRYHFPNSSIDVLVSEVAKPLLEHCPYINTLILEPKKNLYAELKHHQYDTVITLRKSFTTALACWRAGIQTRVGYDKQRFPQPIHFKRWALGLTDVIKYPEDNTTTHQVLHHLKHLSAFDKPIIDSHLELWHTAEDKQHIENLLLTHNIKLSPNTSGLQPRLAGLHSVSASAGKTVPTEQFIDTVKTLSAHGYQIICTGLSSDEARYEKLSQLSGTPLINLAGKTSLRQMFTLFQQIQLMVSVDSGPIHLAAAADIPKLIGIYGPTNPLQWGPHNKDTQFFPVLIEYDQNPHAGEIIFKATQEALNA